MNKRGQSSSNIGIIITIAIALVIAVLLIWGFSTNWKAFSSFFPQDNVGTIASQCSIACNTNSIYDFCSRTFTLYSGTSTFNNATCNYAAQAQPNLGISTCSSLCSNVVVVTSPVANVAALQGKCSESGNSGKVLQALISGTNTVQSVQC